MEGLEIGGVSAARLMTASEMRKEREEFTSFYQQWKSSDPPQILTQPLIPTDIKKTQSTSKPSPTQTLPTKRPPNTNSFEDIHKSSRLS